MTPLLLIGAAVAAYFLLPNAKTKRKRSGRRGVEQWKIDMLARKLEERREEKDWEEVLNDAAEIAKPAPKPRATAARKPAAKKTTTTRKR